MSLKLLYTKVEIKSSKNSENKVFEVLRFCDIVPLSIDLDGD